MNPASGRTADTPIKLGFVTTLSGTAARGGSDMVQAWKAYFESIGSQIAGRKIELYIEDDKHNGAVAITKVRKLVESDGVHLLNGTISANIAYAVAPVVDMMKVPMVFPVTGADDLSKRKRYNWVVRTGFSSSQYGLPFGEWVYNKLGYRRIVALGLDYTFGWELVGSFKKTFEAAGGEIVQTIWIPQGAVNVQTRIKEISKDADACFFATSNLGADVVASNYQKYGPGLPIIGGGPGFDETVLREAGESLLGAVSVSNHSGALETAANVKFRRLLKNKCGEEVPPSMYAEGTYTSGMWIKTAIESIDGQVEDAARLLQALRHVVIGDAPRGPMHLDDYGCPVQNIYIRRVEKVNGKTQNTVIDTIPSVSQFWKYDPVNFLKEPPFTREGPAL